MNPFLFIIRLLFIKNVCEVSDEEHSRYRDEIKHLPSVPLQVDRNNRVVENDEADGDNGNALTFFRTQTD